MPGRLIWLNKIFQISSMAAFCHITNPNTNSTPSPGLELGFGLGLGSPSWWNQSWFYNPF